MAEIVIRTCKHHGETEFYSYPSRKRYPKCRRCEIERASEARRSIKARLIERFGGGCEICGYDTTPRALHFHHIDPSGKVSTISASGNIRSFERVLEEAEKCVLLCSNCHAEVEDGLAAQCEACSLPLTGSRMTKPTHDCQKTESGRHKWLAVSDG